ncbi:EamA family transporter [Photobacterium nomapromontoriensis]|uniref:EamA family transporter n=1 Tax=Photobacterium nomapromontoriensis TaxID=2910237 RepID=UPI003D099C87
MIFSLVIVLSVLFSSSSQLLLKKGAEILVIPNEFTVQSLFKLMLSLSTNFYLVLGVLFQVIALLVWIYVLKKVDVSYAYPFVSLGFVFVIYMGNIIYNEPISLLKILGCATICAGVFMLSKS